MPKKILIVDDEKGFLEVLKARLESKYKVFTASSGEEGLAAALRETPDLILSDIMMPNMNGFDLLKTLKNHARTERVPVIFLSALEGTDSIYKAQEMGATDYLIKPLHLDDLPSVLEKHLL